MKKWFKGFLTGVLAMTVIFSSIGVYAAGGISQTIDVVLNKVNLNMDGDSISSIGENYTLSNGEEVPFSILYKGTTYLPIRKVSELFDKEIGWDGETSTISLGEAKAVPVIQTNTQPQLLDAIYMEFDGELYEYTFGYNEVYFQNEYLYLSEPNCTFVINGLLNGSYRILSNDNPNIGGTIKLDTNDDDDIFENIVEYEGLNTVTTNRYTFYSSVNSNEIILEYNQHENVVTIDESVLTTINGDEYISVNQWAAYMGHSYELSYNDVYDVWVISID